MTRKRNFTRREVIGTMTVAASTVVMDSSVKAGANTSPPLNRWRVQKYSFGWNATARKGLVNLYLENYNRNPVKINVGSPEEFSGYITILKEEPVFYNSSGWLHTGTEDVG